MQKKIKPSKISWINLVYYANFFVYTLDCFAIHSVNMRFFLLAFTFAFIHHCCQRKFIQIRLNQIRLYLHFKIWFCLYSMSCQTSDLYLWFWSYLILYREFIPIGLINRIYLHNFAYQIFCLDFKPCLELFIQVTTNAMPMLIHTSDSFIMQSNMISRLITWSVRSFH